MANNNLEKFVIDLGFKTDDLNKLKSLLKVQEKLDAQDPKRLKRKASELALDRKRLQMEKLIARAKDKGVDTSFYERSLRSSKKLETIEKRRLELERKVLYTKKAQTQEVVKQATPVKAIKQGRFNNSPSKDSFLKQQDQQEAFNTGRNNFVRTIRLTGERAGKSAAAVAELEKEARKLYGTSATAKANMNALRISLREFSQEQRKAIMQTKKHSIAMQGLNDSTRHLIRSYVSVFAVLGATNSINQTGQRFEAMDSAMLAATGTAELAADEIGFLDKMTSRLGLSLLDTSDAYSKFLFASKDKLDQDETRELFEGLSELGTTLGISKEKMKLSMNAITQMMNKGKVSSEELRLQLAESLPGAIQIFARSIGKSEAELFKMMENGELLAADILPKVAKEMKAVAAVGLESKLKTLRVAQGQFFNELDKTQRMIFDNGFKQGLRDLLFTLKEFLAENEEALKGVGKAFKFVFDFVTGVAKVVAPVIITLTSLFSQLGNALEDTFGDSAVKNLASQLAILAIAFRPIYLAAVAILGVMDEIASLFSTGKVGLIETALKTDIDFTKGDLKGLSKLDLLQSITSPRQAFKNVGTFMDNNSGVFTSISDAQLPTPLKVEVTMEEGLEAKVNGVITKNNETQILSGAH